MRKGFLGVSFIFYKENDDKRAPGWGVRSSYQQLGCFWCSFLKQSILVIKASPRGHIHISSRKPSGLVSLLPGTNLRAVQRRLEGLRSGVVGRVGVGVVAQTRQHGGDFRHVVHHVRGDVAHPCGKGVCVDRLHHLVRGSLHPAAKRMVGEFSLVESVKFTLNSHVYIH